jgi:hypothetical protein
LAYDNDEAGNNGVKKVLEQLQSCDITIARVQLPEAMDINEYALNQNDPEDSLKQSLIEAELIKTPKKVAIKNPSEPTPETEPVKMTEPESSIPQTHNETKSPSQSTPADPATANKTEQVTEPQTEDNTKRLTPIDYQSLISKEKKPEPIPLFSEPDIPTEITESEIRMILGARRYRIRGLEKNTSQYHLKINLMVVENNLIHVDTLDLYHGKAKQVYAKQAAEILNTEALLIQNDLVEILKKLEHILLKQIDELLKKEEKDLIPTPEEYEEAMAFLKSADMMQQISDDFDQTGITGEKVNKLVGYLAATSRLLDKPLGVLIQSTSAAGKSSLMDAVLDFMPPEHIEKYSALTGQALYYMKSDQLRHKIVSIAEETGSEKTAYALKLLMSEGELSIGSTGKDPKTGELGTRHYHVESPVMVFTTTTAADIDEELQNRCITLTVNEDRKQTEAIHQIQRYSRTIEGFKAKRERPKIFRRHHHAQRLLQPIPIINPYAESLTFLSDRLRTRRDHEKYMQMIETITNLRQYQKPIKFLTHLSETIRYIETDRDDIRSGNYYASEILGRCLDDMPAQTRHLVLWLDEWVGDLSETREKNRHEIIFCRREVRDACHWSDTQLKIHLNRLVELEYLILHRSKDHRQRYRYELLYDGQGQDGNPFFTGLINPDKLVRVNEPTGEKLLEKINQMKNSGIAI